MTTVQRNDEQLRRNRLRSLLEDVGERVGVAHCRELEDRLEMQTLTHFAHQAPTAAFCMSFVKRGHGIRRSGQGMSYTLDPSMCLMNTRVAESAGIPVMKRVTDCFPDEPRFGVFISEEAVPPLHRTEALAAMRTHHGQAFQAAMPADFSSETWPLWMMSSLGKFDPKDAWRHCTHQMVCLPSIGKPEVRMLDHSMGEHPEFDFLSDGSSLRAFYAYSPSTRDYVLLGAVASDLKHERFVRLGI